MSKSMSFHIRTLMLSAACFAASYPAAAWAGQEQSPRQRIDLLPMLDVTRGPVGDEQRTPIGGYVRFWIEGVPDDEQPQSRMYSLEHRSWLSRYMVGRTLSRNLRVRMVINRADAITVTETLASASFESNRRQGENWSTEFNDRQFLTQFVRIDPGTTAEVHVTLAAATQVSADVTRNLLSIVEAGARLVAPTGPLVTPAVAIRLNQASNFVDNSIASLFSESVEERAVSDFAAESWVGTTHLAEVSALFPIRRPIRDETNSRIIGRWRVVASPPIVSIFSDVPLHPNARRPLEGCETEPEKPGTNETARVLPERDRQACLAFTGLQPATVMRLPVGDNKTLGEALRGDAGIAAAQQRYAMNTAAETKEQRAAATGRELCSLITDRATALGLNPYDVAAAVWAFAGDGSFDSDLAQNLYSDTCPAARLAQRLNLSGIAQSAAPAPAGVAPGEVVVPVPVIPPPDPVNREGSE